MSENVTSHFSAFERLLYQMHGTYHRVVSAEQQPDAPQGASGSQINFYRVVSQDAHAPLRYDDLVTKNASLRERRIYDLLRMQGSAVPPIYIPDLVSEDRALIYMPYMEECSWRDDNASAARLSAADGLAKIHATNRMQPPSWLPHTAPHFEDRLWLRAWREQWERNLADPEFAAEFAPLTKRLEAAMDQFMRTLQALTEEQTTLTLLCVDLIPGHIRWWRDKAYFIDWEQSSYGSLYLICRTYFTVETQFSSIGMHSLRMATKFQCLNSWNVIAK
ncbi:MAG: phosphotransferase [Anaerolineae bacterium]|nr:phosphotransferase [Anaerolineae bacterium]